MDLSNKIKKIKNDISKIYDLRTSKHIGNIFDKIEKEVCLGKSKNIVELNSDSIEEDIIVYFIYKCLELKMNDGKFTTKISNYYSKRNRYLTKFLLCSIELCMNNSKIKKNTFNRYSKTNENVSYLQIEHIITSK